jgi:hypothetical protein
MDIHKIDDIISEAITLLQKILYSEQDRSKLERILGLLDKARKKIDVARSQVANELLHT